MLKVLDVIDAQIVTLSVIQPFINNWVYSNAKTPCKFWGIFNKQLFIKAEAETVIVDATPPNVTRFDDHALSA